MDDTYFCYSCGQNTASGQAADIYIPGSVPAAGAAPVKTAGRSRKTTIIIAAVLLAVALAVTLLIVFLSGGDQSTAGSEASSVQGQTETVNLLDTFFTEGYYFYKSNSLSEQAGEPVYCEICVKTIETEVTPAFKSADFKFYNQSGTVARWDAYGGSIRFSDSYAGPTLGDSARKKDCKTEGSDTVELRFLLWQYARNGWYKGRINGNGTISANHTERFTYRDGSFYSEDGEKLVFSSKPMHGTVKAGETNSTQSGSQTPYMMTNAEKQCLDNYMSYVDDRLVGTWVGDWVYREGNEVISEGDDITYRMVFQNNRMFYLEGNNKISNTKAPEQSSPYLVKDNILTINSLNTSILINWISSDEIMMTSMVGASFNYHMHRESSSTPYSLSDDDRRWIGQLQALSKEGWLLEPSEEEYPKYIYRFTDDRIVFRGYEKDEYDQTIYTEYEFLYALEDSDILYMHENGNQYYLGFGNGEITDIDSFKVTFSDGYTALNMDDPEVFERSRCF